MNNQYRPPFIFCTRYLLYLGLRFSIIGFLYNPIIGNEGKCNKDADCLRVATYNIRREGKEKFPPREWKNRLPAIVKLLENIQPDIIGLQEPIKKQIDDLTGQLENYGWFGQGRGESWGGRGKNEYNPIFYNKKNLILHKQGTFHLNDWKLSWQSWLKQPHVIGLLPRICTWGLFEIKKTGYKFYVYNTHLDHKFTTARLNQLKIIIDIINQNNDTNDNKNNIILLGDFNTDLDGTIQSLVNKEALRNTRDLAKHLEGPRETATGWDDKDLQQIDHILIKNNNEGPTVIVKQHVVCENKGWAAILKSDPVINRHPSDHRPVFVDIYFSQK